MLQKCPVCEGKGTVPVDFYGYNNTSASSEICHTCNGSGVIENYDNNPFTIPIYPEIVI